ncbi:ornithine cyclodeaminase family protein [Rhizobium johnstonii]|uniref:ornithine cyclodeaminase family protein n=1 Tax=Rhizobium TaxID=379 RepID=UPI0010325B9F|nr:ornithine cyclodeaminase family protein [Rhizobium leguminosarum]MBY5344970.1 ornithine cyclodeaminase family protein [Rhizobium leguminosarum]MBY5392677.1 ornithine cyclodeaminase family protein [Rhizobium leguminosarum]MBY5434714.1 ornithine cyclodeaminase family protein [Rhizobium leguminosarum]NEK45173.1 ornithine cyclodeaminase family protein [Rhizobium leguminosarum]NKK53780.1 ornithine cyclodeaminase family protein [Rhizobium leguminosarum bv. viciae]
MTDTQIRILDARTTGELLPFGALVATLRQAFAEGCVVPVRHHHTIANSGEPDATLLLMPAWHETHRSERYLGIKIVTVFPGNTVRGIPGLTSTYMLYDGRTGMQLALLDGNTITARRTVAASALAADYLARKDARRLLVIGAGRVASLIPDAYRAVRPIAHVDIWDIDPASAERLAQSLQQQGLQAAAVTDLEAAVRQADIVSAATLATAPLIRGKWLRPGTHVDLIGGFTPAMREADDEALRRSSVYIDTHEALHEAGDLVQPIRGGVIAADAVRATLDELCRRDVPARTSNDEITLYKAVGTALADLAAATMVYEAVLIAG